jgi:predicted GIY-YIG superfamily endonuclease
MTTCVYWIRHPDHTDVLSQGYIGMSTQVESRWEHHKKKAQNLHLKNAISKYGWDTLVKQQLVVSDIDYCLELEKKLRPAENIGWNIVLGGGKPPVLRSQPHLKGKAPWNKGLTWSDEYKEKTKINVSILWENPEYRKHMSDAHKGQVCPMKGKKHSVETIEKMRLTKLGKKQSQETIEKRSVQLRGKSVAKVTCPHCEKIGGIGAMKLWHFDNCKKRMLYGNDA